MAKRRSQKPIIPGKKKKPVESDDELENAPDPKSNTFYFNEIDDFHAQEEKDERAVMDLDLSDDDDVEEEFNDKDLEFPSDLSDDDLNMESDLENEDEDENDGIPSDKAWGKKKNRFYNTDYTDKDYMGMTGSDGEAAESEEKEALALQKKMAQTLKEADFGLSDFVTEKKVIADKKVTKNLSEMSKEEKMRILMKESPEFLGIVEDFKLKFSEVLRIQQLLPLIDEGKIQGPGALYLKTKFHISLYYLMTIGFYFTLKARHASVENHPVIKRILEYRMLLQQLTDADEQYKLEIDDLLKRINDGEEIPVYTELTEETDKQIYETEDEKKALEMYSMMKDLKQKANEKNKEVEDLSAELSSGSDEEMKTFDDRGAENKVNGDQNGDDDGEEADYDGKRRITYQIAKNKGVAPRRKKEQRNPRVKHRTKFRKANVRRKGQVRVPRTEINRYGGEISGIRAGVRHSIKLK
ncbi:Something about silencing protein 10 [Nymphon striatum]|nr:Something about silencing protein 10 [Nymphon striatum]